MIGYLEKLAEVADGTPWGDDAKKLADSLKGPSSPIAAEISRVQIHLYKMDPRLAPGGGPLEPGGTGPLGPIPGLPGAAGMIGGPIAPAGLPPASKSSGTGFIPAGPSSTPPGPVPPLLTTPGTPTAPLPGPVPPTPTIPKVPVPSGPLAPTGPAPPPGAPPGPIAPTGPPPISPPSAPPGPTPPAKTPPATPPVPPK